MVYQITYQCRHCGWIAPDDYQFMICPKCAGELKGDGFPAINGTRDNFKFENQFVCKKSGQLIDTWKKWEKGGYKDPLKDPTLSDEIKERAKEKRDKIRFYNSRGEDATGKN